MARRKGCCDGLLSLRALGVTVTIPANPAQLRRHDRPAHRRAVGGPMRRYMGIRWITIALIMMGAIWYVFSQIPKLTGLSLEAFFYEQ